MNAIEILCKEHEEHRRLFNEFSGQTGEYGRIRSALVHHVNEEEAVLYPRLLELEKTRGETTKAWKDHNQIMGLIQKLDQETNDILWNALFQELKELHLNHIQEEEEILFPLIAAETSGEYLKEVGEQIVIQKVFEPTEKILYPEVPGSHQI